MTRNKCWKWDLQWIFLSIKSFNTKSYLWKPLIHEPVKTYSYKKFLHVFHRIVHNFVKMTFDLRGHWMSKQLSNSMSFTENFICYFIEYEIVTLKAFNEWTSQDILTKFFVHIFHRIFNNFVKVTFDPRGHWTTKKIGKKVWPIRKFLSLKSFNMKS